MSFNISNQRKWIALALALLLVYVGSAMLWAMARISNAQIDNGMLSPVEKIQSSFIVFSPSLLLFGYFVWRTYKQGIKRVG